MEQPHYTPQQWDMTHRIMDLVDEQRHRSNAPWSDEDTRKVVALVQRTYQSQGLEVDQRLIDKALAISSLKDDGWWAAPRFASATPC